MAIVNKINESAPTDRGMLVSIVVNNYNYERFLRLAVQSALDQTYSNVQVIVVDDGSTDNSRDVIESFGARIFPVFKSNGGQGSAFNAGWAVSEGELILFLDADDTLSPNAVAQVVASWTGELSKLQFPLEIIDEAGQRTGALHPKRPLASGDVLATLLEEGSYSTAPTTGNAFARHFLSAVMPIPEEQWPDDADSYLIHLAPFFGSIGLQTSPLGQYRVHGSSLTTIAANGGLRVEKLQKRLRSDVRQQMLLDGFCLRTGYKMRPGAVMNTWSHYKVRLASLKVSSEGHPFADDRLHRTAGQLLSRIWKARDLRVQGKLAFTVWAAGLLIVPRSVAKLLIVSAFSSQSTSPLRAALAGTHTAPAYQGDQ